MARPSRLEFAGALYHVTSRGYRREDIYEDDEDRVALSNVLASVARRFNWLVHAYCLMSNHYHLLIDQYMRGVFLPVKDRYGHGDVLQHCTRARE